jgi:HSP20 family protein
METTLTKRTTVNPAAYWNTPFAPFMAGNYFGFPATGGFVECTPSLNVREERNEYVIDIATPGLKKHDFEINVDGNCVNVSANVTTIQGSVERTLRSEFDFTCFSRSIALPEYADTTRMNAEYTNGILTLTVPKTTEGQKSTTQKIRVH